MCPHARLERGPDADPRIGRPSSVCARRFSRAEAARRGNARLREGQISRDEHKRFADRGEVGGKRGRRVCGGGVGRDGSDCRVRPAERQAGDRSVRLAGRRRRPSGSLRRGPRARAAAPARSRRDCRRTAQAPHAPGEPASRKRAPGPQRSLCETPWSPSIGGTLDQGLGLGQATRAPRMRNRSENDASLHWTSLPFQAHQSTLDGPQVPARKRLGPSRRSTIQANEFSTRTVFHLDSPNCKTVLVVDDDRDIRDVLTDALEAEGYRVVTAADGQDALNWLPRGHRATVHHPARPDDAEDGRHPASHRALERPRARAHSRGRAHRRSERHRGGQVPELRRVAPEAGAARSAPGGRPRALRLGPARGPRAAARPSSRCQTRSASPPLRRCPSRVQTVRFIVCSAVHPLDSVVQAARAQTARPARAFARRSATACGSLTGLDRQPEKRGSREGRGIPAERRPPSRSPERGGEAPQLFARADWRDRPRGRRPPGR